MLNSPGKRQGNCYTNISSTANANAVGTQPQIISQKNVPLRDTVLKLGFMYFAASNTNILAEHRMLPAQKCKLNGETAVEKLCLRYYCC